MESLEEGLSAGGEEVEGGVQWKNYNIMSPCQDGKKGIRLIIRYMAGLPKVYGMVVNCKIQSRIIRNSQKLEAVQVFLNGYTHTYTHTHTQWVTFLP